MRKLLLFLFLIFSLSIFSQRGTISVEKKEVDTIIPKLDSFNYPNQYYYFGIAGSYNTNNSNIYSWDFLIGLNSGLLISRHLYFSIPFGVKYTNYSNSPYNNGGSLGWFFGIESRRFGLNYGLHFSRVYGFKNNLADGLDKYDEITFAPHLRYVHGEGVHNLQVSININLPKSFDGRNTYLVPALTYIYKPYFK